LASWAAKARCCWQEKEGISGGEKRKEEKKKGKKERKKERTEKTPFDEPRPCA